jgi:hypothetical protein
VCSPAYYWSFACAVTAALAQAGEVYARAERLALIAPEISATRAYLSEMTFGREHHERSVHRYLVAGRIGLGNRSSLSNVLDEEVLEFLRSLVSQP